MIIESMMLTDQYANKLRMDGKLYTLEAGNFGAPTFAYETRQTYQQHAEIVAGYSLAPRILAVTVYAPRLSPSDYYSLRRQLLDFINIARAPLTLKITLLDNTQYEITVRPDTGLTFGPISRDEGHRWELDEPITFIAHDPIWNGDTVTHTPVAGTATELVFPITFPITFNSAGTYYSTGALSYSGSWLTYPTITISGPYNVATINCVATGSVITLNRNILAGEQRILTLAREQVSLVDAGGTNRLYEMTPDSDLLDFAILPAGLFSGAQQIDATLVGGSAGVSSVTIAYRKRYYGI